MVGGRGGRVGPGRGGGDLLTPAGGGRVLQEHHAAAGGRHLRGRGRGEVEPAQAHCSAHGHDGWSQAGHVSGTGGVQLWWATRACPLLPVGMG